MGKPVYLEPRSAAVLAQMLATDGSVTTADIGHDSGLHLSAVRGDPEPGPNRGRSFWHCSRNRMVGLGELPGDDASRSLAREYVARQKQGKGGR